MTSALEILKAHFSAQKPRRMEIPLPGLSPLVFFARPLTLADHAALSTHLKDEAAFVAHALVRALRREDGTPAFTLEDVFHLKQSLPAALVRKLADFVLEEGPGDAELGEFSEARLAPSPAPSSPLPAAAVPMPAPSLSIAPPPLCADGLPTIL